MNQTPNYQLNQWDAEDRVLRTDFNADNEKIDAALSRCGNCRVRVSTYIGDGELTRTFTFNRKPALVMTFGELAYCIMAPGPKSLPNARLTNNYLILQNWTNNSVTVSCNYSDAQHICNEKDKVYTIVVFDTMDTD